MKKYILLNLLCLFSVAGMGQITYTGISFPQAGDVLEVSTALDTLLTVTPPSATATAWDFSHFVAINSRLDTIQPASNGADFAMFPNTEVLQTLNGQIGIAYTDVTATQIEKIGGGLEFFGISFVDYYDDPHVTQVTPLTYPDVAAETYVFNFGEHIDSIPFLRQLIDSFAQIPFGLSPDSIRISVSGTEDRAVDAWGTCMMADTTYDVLRQKVVTAYDIAIEVSVVVPFFGQQWIDVGSFISLPFPTSATVVRYDFLAEGMKQPIVTLNLDSAETFITSIEFLDSFISNPPTIDVRYLEDELNVNIFPNPAQRNVMVEMAASDIPVDGYRLHIVDMLGRIALTENKINEDRHQVNVSTIPNGHYVVVLQNQEGTILKRQQLEIFR